MNEGVGDGHFIIRCLSLLYAGHHVLDAHGVRLHGSIQLRLVPRLTFAQGDNFIFITNDVSKNQAS